MQSRMLGRTSAARATNTKPAMTSVSKCFMVTWGERSFPFWNLWPLGDAVVDNLQHALALFALEHEARGADPFLAEAAFLHGQFDVLHELGADIEVEQRREPAVNGARFVPFPRAG